MKYRKIFFIHNHGYNIIALEYNLLNIGIQIQDINLEYAIINDVDINLVETIDHLWFIDSMVVMEA